MTATKKDPMPGPFMIYSDLEELSERSEESLDCFKRLS